MFKKLNNLWNNTITFCKGKDDDPIVFMEKSSDKVKSRRKQLHAKKEVYLCK